jgi:hypothetical protein
MIKSVNAVEVYEISGEDVAPGREVTISIESH